MKNCKTVLNGVHITGLRSVFAVFYRRDLYFLPRDSFSPFRDSNVIGK